MLVFTSHTKNQRVGFKAMYNHMTASILSSLVKNYSKFHSLYCFTQHNTKHFESSQALRFISLCYSFRYYRYYRQREWSQPLHFVIFSDR